MAEATKRIKISKVPIATSIEGFNAFGIRKNADDTIDNVHVPMDLLKGNVGDKGDQGIQGPQGEQGEQGPQGNKGEGLDYSTMTPEEIASITGVKGDTGIGIPIGGTTGQQLMKKSNVDYDFEWQTPAGAGDMLKSEYDKNGNGIVDNAEKGRRFYSGDKCSCKCKFTDTNTVTYINGKTGEIAKADIVALGIPAQDTVYTHPSRNEPSWNNNKQMWVLEM